MLPKGLKFSKHVKNFENESGPKLAYFIDYWLGFLNENLSQLKLGEYSI